LVVVLRCLPVLCKVLFVIKERLARIDQEVAEEDIRLHQEFLSKKSRIEHAEKKRADPVNDSEMVDDLFGNLDASSDSYEGMGPQAFQVIIFIVLLA